MGSDAEMLYDEGRVVPESSGCSAVTSSEDETQPQRRAQLRYSPPFPHIVTPKGRLKKLHPCPYCDAVFHKKAKLTAHERTHTGERPFACSICSASFSRNAHLLRHQAVHLMAVDRTVFPCDVCGFMFRCKDHLRRHQSRECLPNRHQCTECGMVVASEYHLKKHIAKHERQQSKAQAPADDPPLQKAIPILCDVCNELLSDKRALKKHIVASHGYKCPECDGYFASMDERRAHMRTHTNDVYACTYEGCGRVYSRQSNLRQHVRSKHLHERHECPVCRASCTFRGVLQRHMQTYHPEEAAAMSQSSSQLSTGGAVDAGGDVLTAGVTATEEEAAHVSTGEEEPALKRQRLVLKPKQRRPYERAFFTRLLGTLEEDLDLDHPTVSNETMQGTQGAAQRGALPVTPVPTTAVTSELLPPGVGPTFAAAPAVARDPGSDCQLSPTSSQSATVRCA